MPVDYSTSNIYGGRYNLPAMGRKRIQQYAKQAETSEKAYGYRKFMESCEIRFECFQFTGK